MKADDQPVEQRWSTGVVPLLLTQCVVTDILTPKHKTAHILFILMLNYEFD